MWGMPLSRRIPPVPVPHEPQPLTSECVLDTDHAAGVGTSVTVFIPEGVTAVVVLVRTDTSIEARAVEDACVHCGGEGVDPEYEGPLPDPAATCEGCDGSGAADDGWWREVVSG